MKVVNVQRNTVTSALELAGCQWW